MTLVAMLKRLLPYDLAVQWKTRTLSRPVTNALHMIAMVLVIAPFFGLMFYSVTMVPHEVTRRCVNYNATTIACDLGGTAQYLLNRTMFVDRGRCPHPVNITIFNTYWFSYPTVSIVRTGIPPSCTQWRAPPNGWALYVLFAYIAIVLLSMCILKCTGRLDADT